MKYTRYIPIAGTAIATTFSLFYLMQALVTTEDVMINETPVIRMPVFIREIDDQLPVRKPEFVEKPVEVEKAPDPEPVPKKTGHGKGPDIGLGRPSVIDHSHVAVFNPIAVDGERIPLVRVQPEYPERCAARGLSGSVVVEFDIDRYGAVINPHILDDSDGSCFRRSALRAIKRFKYKPAVINGQPHGAENIRFRMVYELAPE